MSTATFSGMSTATFSGMSTAPFSLREKGWG